MPENNQANGSPNKADSDDKHAFNGNAPLEVYPIGLRRILLVGGILLGALLLVSIFVPHMSERVKFFTVNALSLLVLIAIAVQAYIYRRQWAAMDTQAGMMQGQLKAMQDGLEETRKIVEQNERAVKVAERSVEIAQENTIYVQRAYVSVTRGEVHGDIFTLVIENTGNTPANGVEILAMAEIGEQPPNPETSSAKWTTMGVIAPDEYIKRMIVRSGEATHEMRELVSGGKTQFFCSGVIRYKDIFKNQRQTKFGFYQRFGSNQLDPCATGNEAD